MNKFLADGLSALFTFPKISKPRVGFLLTLVCFITLLSSCNNLGTNPTNPGGNGGATTGGVQDFQVARELVNNGKVPPKEAFVVEGLFSEYDLALESDNPCDKPFCLNGALGIAPNLNDEARVFVQVGLSSGLDLANLERPSLSLVLVIDISGSMGYSYQTSYNEYQEPLKVAKAFLEQLIPNLEAKDEVAVVVFGSSARTLLGFQAGNQHETILSQIRSLQPGGSTAMAAGMRLSYEVMCEASKEEKRLLLFSDEQANVGQTSYNEFKTIAQQGIDQGMGLTLFGIGLGLRTDLFSLLSTLRGGNAFSLYGSREVSSFIEEDWPFFVFPLAYDLEMRLLASQGFSLSDSYGFPSDGSAQEITLKASSIFLSRRRGALLVELSPGQILKNYDRNDFEGLAISTLLSYESRDRKLLSESLALNYQGEALADGYFYQQVNLGKTVALAMMAANMQEVARLYSTNRPAARALMTKVLTRIKADAENYPELMPEVGFAEKLQSLVQQNAPQGTLY
ncbi:MAG: VWA domain-containing protein [Deinococcales bacterium]